MPPSKWTCRIVAGVMTFELVTGEPQAHIVDNYPTAPIYEPVVVVNTSSAAMGGVAFSTTITVGNWTNSGTW